MKNLFLIRHAKSDWDDIGLKDFDRPLNKRGHRNAPFMAGMLHQRIDRIDLVVSSPANRAITTASYFAREFGIHIESIKQELKIYEAPLYSLLEVVNDLDNNINSVLMFGHNPGFSHFLAYLTGEISHMPTCSIAQIQFDLEDWKLVSANTGRLIDLDYPKRYSQ